MMSQTQSKQGKLFLATIDDLISKDHFLRKLDKAVDFSFIYGIDEILSPKPAGFDAFLSATQTTGYEAKPGKRLVFRALRPKEIHPPARTGRRVFGAGDPSNHRGQDAPFSQPVKGARQEPQRVNLLVDIQTKLQAGKGPGYERWAKVFNLKQMAQTMNFLTENNLLEYAELEEKPAAATARFNELTARIKAAETRMAEIGNLKTHIVNYSKTRDVYTAHRKAGYSKKFYEENASDILLHKAVKTAFDALPGKKIPTIKALQVEYKTLLSEKKKAYTGYTAARKEMEELLTAKMNIDRLLGDAQEQPKRTWEQDR